MRSPETHERLQEQAQARYQSGTSRFQAATNRAVARRHELSSTTHHLYQRTARNVPFLLAQAPDLGQSSNLWTKIRDVQANVQDVESFIAQRRHAMDQSPDQGGQQATRLQEDRASVGIQRSQQEESSERRTGQTSSNPGVLPEGFQRQSQGSTALNSNPSHITYNFQGAVNGFTQVNISGATTPPQFIQNISTDSSKKRAREAVDEQDSEKDENEIPDTPVRRSGRPRKKSRKAQHLD